MFIPTMILFGSAGSLGIPTAFNMAAKMVKRELNDEEKNEIAKNCLYHVTTKEAQDAIMKSGYIRPSNFYTSYGKPAVCFFNGLPKMKDKVSNEMQSFILNLTKSPYVNSYDIFYAIKVSTTEKELNRNYKIRPMADNAILYEGYCLVKDKNVEKAQLVFDLMRDKDGKAKIDLKTGRPLGIEVRERTEEEMKESKDKYIPKQDFIEYIEAEKKRRGYLNSTTKIANTLNKLSLVGRGIMGEASLVVKTSYNTYKRNLDVPIGRKQKLLDEPPQEKIKRILDNNEFYEKRRPYSNEKYALFVTDMINKRTRTKKCVR